MQDGSEEVQRLVHSLLVPQPMQLLRPAVEPLDPAGLDVPVAYVLGSEDVALPEGEYGWARGTAGRRPLRRPSQPRGLLHPAGRHRRGLPEGLSVAVTRPVVELAGPTSTSCAACGWCSTILVRLPRFVFVSVVLLTPRGRKSHPAGPPRSTRMRFRSPARTVVVALQLLSRESRSRCLLPSLPAQHPMSCRRPTGRHRQAATRRAPG